MSRAACDIARVSSRYLDHTYIASEIDTLLLKSSDVLSYIYNIV